MTSVDTPSFLQGPALPLLLFGGKGGVGKTSCATATALQLAAASPAAAFLLLSTDPAHSLADSLGDAPLPQNLQLLELDAGECLAAFKREHGAKLQEIALRGTFLDKDDIGQFLDLSLPGLDELMAALEIGRKAESGAYCGIVVDTAPTGHTLRLLAMPALLHQWLEALEALLAKDRYMRAIFAGRPARDELGEFLRGLAASVDRLDALLRDPLRCRFVPVMLAEELSVSETCVLLASLRDAGVPVADLIVNRLVPANDCVTCAAERARQMQVLRKDWEAAAFTGCVRWGVPLYPDEVRGPAALQSFWAGAIRLTKPGGAAARLPAVPPRVESPAPPPATGKRLLLFAGKGGVGKTTLACATALRLAQERPGRECLLFSTDPAHSLSACLQRPVGPKPKQLWPGLSALEIDAQAEFDALKQLYSADLRRWLQILAPNMDLTYDREAMEKMLDLSPPGLDEIMALSRVGEFLGQDRYHTVIIDSAPTGHFLRLLEMPELVNRWLKVFFGLFLKYKRIFQLPNVANRLVRLSRELRDLRAILADPARCDVCAVAILTEMSFQETTDLVAACARMQIHVPSLFLNLATPPGDCSLCTARHRAEQAVGKRFAQAFPAQRQVLVYRRGEPRGEQHLGALGRALYLS